MPILCAYQVETNQETLLRIALDPSFAVSLASSRMVGIEFAPLNRVFCEGETLGFLFTNTTVIDLRAPIQLEVVRQNMAVIDDPRLAQTSPMTRGWLLEVRAL